jgi:hypothetical protein
MTDFTVWESWLTLFLDYAGLTLDDIHGLYSSRLRVRVVSKIWRWGRIKPLESKLYAAGGTLIDAFWKTLVGNYVLKRTKFYTKAKAKDERAFWRTLRYMIGDGAWKHGSQEATFFNLIRRATFCRRFFITKEGYLGLGPRNMQVGDEIHIVAGGNCPLVLRKAPHERSIQSPNPTYTLLGDCYLHGVMDGEAAENFEGRATKIDII